MSIDETIKKHVEDAVRPLQDKIDLLLSAIVVQQKDAAALAGVTTDTVRNKATRGEVEILQRTGSRLNYITLKETSTLKVKKAKK